MECPHCSKRYTHPNSYHRHVRNECIAVEPKFACPDCGSRFKRKAYLRDHHCPVILIQLTNRFLNYKLINYSFLNRQKEQCFTFWVELLPGLRTCLLIPVHHAAPLPLRMFCRIWNPSVPVPLLSSSFQEERKAQLSSRELSRRQQESAIQLGKSWNWRTTQEAEQTAE